MKIILNESNRDKMIEGILNKRGIEINYEYGLRSYSPDGGQYDVVNVWFKYPNQIYEYSRLVTFKTKKDYIIKMVSHGDLASITDEFEAIPRELVNGYFIERARVYLEKLLPIINFDD